MQSEVRVVENPVLLAMREIKSIRHGTDAVRLLLGEDTSVLPEYIRAVREGDDAAISAKGRDAGTFEKRSIKA